MVEILVVIAVIVILAAMTSYGVSSVIKGQRVSNTQNAMRTIQKVLNEHWAYVVADAKKESGLATAFARMDQVFGADTTGGERNRIFWIKFRLMEAFPTSYMEVHNFYPYSLGLIPPNLQKNIATYLKVLGNRLQDKNPGPPNGPIKGSSESSACLLMALSISRNGTALNIDNLGSSNVADTDGDGMMEFVDAWGNPLTFFRFPTDNHDLQFKTPNPSSPYADPMDPAGVLFQWAMNPANAQGRRAYEANVHKMLTPYSTLAPPNSPPNSPPPQAAYVVPTLVSSGPDGILGLTPSYMNVIAPKPPKNIPDSLDNIFSFNLN